FWIEVPYRKSPEDVVSELPSLPKLDSLKVLIVDDEKNARDIAQMYITSWGMQCATTAGALQALEILHEAARTGQPYDLVMVDYLMPEMDGLELGEAIANDASINGVKRILFTGYDERGQARRAMDAGFSAYLVKPLRQSK